MENVLGELGKNIRELELALKSSQKISDEEINKHGWDERDKSRNISIEDNNQLAKRNNKPNHTDGLRGRIGYRGGIFLFDFEWQPAKDKNVTIGLATQKATLHCEGRKALIGANEHSIGWDLVNRCIRFNDCKIKAYPDSEESEIPSRITMVLDMSDGKVSFRAGSREYGVAMKGLKHLAEKFYVAASMDEPGDYIRMTFLGGLEGILRRRSLATSQPSQSKKDCLTFHSICGQNIRLSNGNRTAERVNNMDTQMYATVLTKRPLLDGETFTLRCDSRNKMYRGGWVVGATTVSPLDINFPKEMTRCEQGKRWLFNENKILVNNRRIEYVNTNLDDLKSGEMVSVKKSKGQLHFYVNGNRLARVDLETNEDIYGVVDVFGKTTRVALLDEDLESPDEDEAPSSSEIASSSSRDVSKLLMGLLPKTHEEFMSRLIPTMERMKEKNPETIEKVRHHLKINLLIPIGAMTRFSMKRRAAEALADVKDSAQVMTEYLEFLWKQGVETDEKTWKCYDTLLDIVTTFSDKSLVLCRGLGQSGFVKRVIQELHRMKDTDERTEKESRLVRRYFVVLHNCAKATENRKIYRECEFLQIGKVYADFSSDDDFIAVWCSLTMSYICDDDQLHLLELSDQMTENLVRLLQKAADNEKDDGSHSSGGCHCHELAVGITNLSRNPKNIPKFMKQDAISQLVKMLDFRDAFDLECGLNGIWSLVTSENRKEIIQCGGLSLKLRRLASHDQEAVQQAAIRLLTRLVNMPDQGKSSVIQKRQCEYKAKCERYKKHLNLPEEYFDSSMDICYCPECHGMRGDEAYYSGGQPQKRYGVPVGWCFYGLSLPPRAKVHNVLEKWHRAYHGTKQDHIEGILSVGEIVPAGQPVLGGKKIIEGSGHFKDDWKPLGFDTKRVFMSPSMRYAAIDAYAKPKCYIDPTTDKRYIAKIAMQVMIAPNSYMVSEQTVGANEELDPGFSNQELEWSTNQHGSCILQGILVKLTSED